METIAKQNLCWKRVFALIKEAQHNISCKLSRVRRSSVPQEGLDRYNNHDITCLTPTAE